MMTTGSLMMYFILPSRKKALRFSKRNTKVLVTHFPFDMLNVHFNIYKRNFSLNSKKEVTIEYFIFESKTDPH